MAARDLAPGEVVARFEGPILPFARVPEGEIRHAILLGEDAWMVPETEARFMNHACDPNCAILDSLEAATLRPVRAGEELTFRYNAVTAEELANDAASLFWDERWTFPCACGSPQCQGVIDRYCVVEPPRLDQA